MGIKEEYEDVVEKNEKAKQKAEEIMEEWEREGIAINEAKYIVGYLKDGITDAYHKWERETPFRKIEKN